MASNDQIIGGLVTVISIVALGVEFVLLILKPAADATILRGIPSAQYWAITIPLFLGIFGVLGIVAWIGYTMAKTPPPEAWDVEEFESEFEDSVKDDENETSESTE